MKVLVLVLGNYFNLKEICDFVNEDFMPEHSSEEGYDMCDISLTNFGKDYKFNVIDFNDEVNLTERLEFLKNNKIEDINVKQWLEENLLKNLLRKRSDEDVFGLYSDGTKLTLNSKSVFNIDPEDGIENLTVDMHFNFLIKSQSFSNDYDMVIIVDNMDKNLSNNIDQIDYILKKFDSYCVVYTNKKEELQYNLGASKEDLEIKELEKY